MKTKGGLRKELATKLAQMSEAKRAEQSVCIMERVEALPSFQNSQVVLLYWSMDREVQTHKLIERWCERKVVLLPVMSGDTLIVKRFTSRSEMECARFGIWEPKGDEFTEFDKIGMILVPGVGFDRAGNRLGHGKGFYDKLLPQINGHKVGVCFDFQLLDQVEVEPHDIAVDIVITP